MVFTWDQEKTFVWNLHAELAKHLGEEEPQIEP